jgi:hypothetical protein
VCDCRAGGEGEGGGGVGSSDTHAHTHAHIHIHMQRLRGTGSGEWPQYPPFRAANCCLGRVASSKMTTHCSVVMPLFSSWARRAVAARYTSSISRAVEDELHWYVNFCRDLGRGVGRNTEWWTKPTAHQKTLVFAGLIVVSSPTLTVFCLLLFFDSTSPQTPQHPGHELEDTKGVPG